ncbi:B-cell receptor CD22-like isoform X1 [Paramuricea clavata]|uniref:B-cell receptor CD22-like isoform X1 n=1 Tax=Paramuricea clavata TaxID=317549 RepID=A0A6S7GCF5_PARCT|nr:B-cell receptor CD22-like isoform X1 [Paramuricea clavata]
MFSCCLGQVQPPSNGTRLIFFPGSTVKIDWSYVGDISQVDLRFWFFNSSDGSRTGRLARVLEDGDPGQQDFSLIPRFEIDKPATLILKNVDQSYNGMYTFSLLDKKSAQPQTSEVVVFIAKKPTVTLTCYSSVIFNECDDFTCECQGLGGNPSASVTWYKDGKKIAGTGTEKQILTLMNVDETDRGTYKCVTESYPSTMHRDEKSIRVDVKFGPKDTSIELKPNPAILGRSFTITCNSRGFPEPSYTISHNGSHLINAKTYTDNDVAWTDAGVYECNAGNERGNDTASEVLKVTERGQPTQLPTIPNTSKYDNGSGEVTSSKVDCESSGTVVVWHIVLSLVSGFILGIFFSYIVSYSRSRWFRNRKPERNPETKTTEADTTYQELDLSKMNTEDNYQSLRVNAAVCNDATNDDDSTYTQLSKTRDVEDNYQSLT